MLFVKKLDKVGPVDNRPSTNKFHNFVKKKKMKIGHMTHDMWHVTCGTWHMTCDMLFRLPSSYALWFMISWRLGGKGSRSYQMNDGGDCRTAPATPGLLKQLDALHWQPMRCSKCSVLRFLRCLDIFWPNAKSTVPP